MTTNEPEWNAENQNRKSGSTNFHICGWCEHTRGGASRYGCMLESSCSLLKDYRNNEVKWNTECMFVQLGQLDLVDIVSSKCREIGSLTEQIRCVENEIRNITSRIPNHSNSPPLPNNRSHDFMEGEVIYVVVEGKWERGAVVTGYRSHDGMVSYCLDNIPEATNWGCGVCVPHVLREWEWEYFRDHAYEFITWKQTCEAKTCGGKKITLPPICKVVPQIKLGDAVNVRNSFTKGYWIGSVTKISFQVDHHYVVEVDECSGDGRAMFSTGALKWEEGSWRELPEN